MLRSHGGVREQVNPASCGLVFDEVSTRTPPHFGVVADMRRMEYRATEKECGELVRLVTLLAALYLKVDPERIYLRITGTAVFESALFPTYNGTFRADTGEVLYDGGEPSRRVRWTVQQAMMVIRLPIGDRSRIVEAPCR